MQSLTALLFPPVSGLGVDIDDNLMDRGRQLAQDADVSHLVSFQHQDLFSVELSTCDLLYLFLLPPALQSLSPSIANQLKEKQGRCCQWKVVSNTWAVPGLEEYHRSNGASLGFHLYTSLDNTAEDRIEQPAFLSFCNIAE